MNKITKVELLAPAGNLEKLKTAFHFGADAVYLSGKQYGLRAFADNFDAEEMIVACNYAHNLGKKVYVTINIFANNNDFDGLDTYLASLESAGVDAVIVSDLGVVSYVKANSNLAIHISTQANSTNKYTVDSWHNMGAERVVLARELSLEDICTIHNHTPDCQLEAFVHGAMCISYSGRCLMSSYLNGRDGNRGQCVQACRWEWQINEVSRKGEVLTLTEDERGTYLFNSRDLCMIEHIDKLIDAGVCSFKIEGRMKSAFYVATVVNAYRRAIDNYYANGSGTTDSMLIEELDKASHRKYTTGFFLPVANSDRQYYDNSHAEEESKFLGKVVSCADGVVTIEQRNKFVAGDTLETLSCGVHHNMQFVADNIVDSEGNSVVVCNVVQQLLTMPCQYTLYEGDLVRLPKKK